MNRLLAVLAATVLALGGGAALAGPASAEVSIDPVVPVAPGESLAVSGAGCPATHTVEISVWSTVRGSRAGAMGTTDATGGFALTVPLVATTPEPFVGGEQVGVAVYCNGGTPTIDVPDKTAFVFLLFPSPPVVSLSLSAPQQVVGSSLTLTVEVDPATLGALVVLLDGEPLEPVDDYWIGIATYALPADLALGRHTLSAEFDPLAEGPTATATRTFEVVKQPTSTALTLSRPGWRYGATRPTATATVSPALAGTVRFTIGGKAIGKPVAVVGGKAKVRLPARSPGKRAVVATFVPASAGNVAGSTSTARNVKVSKALAVAKVKVAKKIRHGAKVGLTIAVKVKGVAKPTGKIAIYDGKKKVRTATMRAKHRGRLTVKLAGLERGTHTLSVRYLGSKNIKADRSPKVKARVR